MYVRSLFSQQISRLAKGNAAFQEMEVDYNFRLRTVCIYKIYRGQTDLIVAWMPHLVLFLLQMGINACEESGNSVGSARILMSRNYLFVT